jgi:hypothetical protein
MGDGGEWSPRLITLKEFEATPVDKSSYVPTETVVVKAPTLLVGRHHHVAGDVIDLSEERAKAEVKAGTVEYTDRVNAVVSGPDRARLTRPVQTAALAAPPRDAARFTGKARGAL